MSISGNNSRKQCSHRNLVETGSWNVLSFPTHRQQDPAAQTLHPVSPTSRHTRVEALLSFSSPFPFSLHKTSWWSFPCLPHPHHTYPSQLFHHQTDFGIGSPRGRQSIPVKCPKEGEWKGILHPAQPLGTIFPAQIPGRRRQRGSQRYGRKPPESEGQLGARAILQPDFYWTSPLGSCGTPGGTKSSRDWDSAREETWGSSGNTEECFCYRCTIRQPALTSELPCSKSKIPKWCHLNIYIF